MRSSFRDPGAPAPKAAAAPGAPPVAHPRAATPSVARKERRFCGVTVRGEEGIAIWTSARGEATNGEATAGCLAVPMSDPYHPRVPAGFGPSPTPRAMHSPPASHAPTRPTADASAGLARRLGAFDATMIVMGGIVGAGIFRN